MSGTNGLYSTPVDATQRLQQRLNEPETAEALEQILNNLQLIAFSVSALDGFVRRSETIADNVAAGLAEVKAAAPVNASQTGEQLAALLQALPQLTQITTRLVALTTAPEFNRLLDLLQSPQTLTALGKLLQHAELIAFLINALNDFLARGDVVADNLATGIAELRKLTPPTEMAVALQTLPQLVQVLPQLLHVAPQLIEVATRLQPVLASAEFAALMNSGVLHPKTVAFVGQTGSTLVASLESDQLQPQPIGFWGLFQALRNPDVQRALGFLVSFSQHFGQNLARSA